MSVIVRTSITTSELNVPIINANEAKIGKLSLENVEALSAKEAFIENLTIRELTVLENDAIGNTNSSETYETATFNEVVLKFADEFNCSYTIADDSILENSDGCKILNINFQIPTELGSRLVCRYLVLDLRNESEDTDVVTVWNNGDSIKWLYGMPDIQAGYFYVIAFQRFAKDLIVGNVAVKLGGE